MLTWLTYFEKVAYGNERIGLCKPAKPVPNIIDRLINQNRMKSRYTPSSTFISVPVEGAGSAHFDYPFYLVLLFLILDYGRPQSFFPFIEALHPGWFIQGALFLCLISRGLLKLYDIQPKCFFLLLLFMAIHVPIAVNNYWAFQMFKSMLLYFIVYLSITNFVNSYPKVDRFIGLWVIIMLFCAIVGIINGGTVPNSSFMADENDFALVMNMATPFAYFMSLQADRFKKKLFYICVVGVFIAGTIASRSRGGFIGLVTVGLFCWLKSPRKIRSTVAVALMVAVVYLSAPPTYWDEVRSIQEQNIQEGTGQERWYTWQCGWNMFLDHPIIGVGQGNFRWNFVQYEPAGGFQGRTHGLRDSHSIYVTLISELGVIGTILFFSLLYYSVRDMKVILNSAKTHPALRIQSEAEKDAREKLTKLRLMALGVQGAFTGYLISGIFLSVLYLPYFWFLVAFSLAIAKVGKRYSQCQR